MTYRTPQKDLEEIQNIFTRFGFESQIVGNYCIVKDTVRFGKNPLYSVSKPVKINKVKNAVVFIKGRL